MKIKGVVIKLWTSIMLMTVVVMTVVILLLSMIFQTQFLFAFYYEQEIKRLEKDAANISKHISAQSNDFTISNSSVIRRLHDVIIVTDEKAKIRYISGTSDYNIGENFGIHFLSRIMENRNVNEKSKMIQNLDSLLVGVPIVKKSMVYSADDQQPTGEGIFEITGKSEVVGAVYIITPLEHLETTRNALRTQFIYIFAGAIFVSVMISYFLSQSFSKPLIQINNAAIEISKGNYNTNFNMKSSAEIEMLGETINNLARQLSRVENIRREFIANVSHEIRTPLSYLQGYTEILLDGLAENEEERQKYLGIILEEAVRLRRMVDEILRLSQIEAGFIQLKKQPFSMDDLMRRTMDKLQPLASKRNIVIQFNQSAEEALLCIGDPNYIKQVLINLITNAIKHSFDYGNVIVSTYGQQDRIHVCVRDFGGGISEEDIPFIWDRFYTVDKSVSQESTGLGLAIVKQIINAHHSEISVSSVIDEGTEFCFWLPAYSSEYINNYNYENELSAVEG